MRRPRYHVELAILVGLAAVSSIFAANEALPRIGLVLGGGGARGGAHIGVLRVMEELRVPVDCIAGTSMGALVGALYSAGYSPDEIERIVGRIPWEEAFRDAPDRRRLSFRQKQDDVLALFPFEIGFGRKGISGRKGILEGTRLDFVFRSLTLEATGFKSFDQLHVPYRAIATDLRTADMVVLDHGDLARAMRASMSVPGVFSPVEIDGRVLIDGGISRNIPVDVARSMGAARVIVIDVGTPARESVRDLSAIGVLSQTLAALGERNREASRAEIGPDDLLITPELGHFGASDFVHILDTIPMGEAAAREHEAELRRYSVSEAEYADFRRRVRRESAAGLPTVRVDSIRVEGLRRVPAKAVLRRLETRPGDPLNVPVLYRDLDRIWQFGDFESVGYRIDRSDSGNCLVIEAREKSWGPAYLRVGFSLNSDFEGDNNFNLITEIRRPNLNRRGAEWKTVLALGTPFVAFTEFYQPFRAGGSWFVAPRLSWTRKRTETYLVNGDYEGLKSTTAGGGIDLGLQFRNYGEVRLGALWERLYFDPTTTTTVVPVHRKAAGPRFQAAVDQLDDAFFPTRGNRSTLEVFLSRRSFGADDQYDAVALRSEQVGTLGRNTLVGEVEAGTSLGTSIPFYSQFELGGFMNLSGLERGSRRGDVKALFTLADYWRVKKFGSLGKLYVGLALQAGNVWPAQGAVSFGDLIYSGTLFVGINTKSYPVYLGFGLAEGGEAAGYVTVGRAF